MNPSAYINFNGSVVDASQPMLTHRNRAFRYGDAVFETIRMMNGEILYFDKHLARLKHAMTLLGMEDHEDFSFQNLYLLIRHLDQVNGLKGNGRVRLEVFREDGGYYTPLSNKVSYLIEVEKIAEREYRLNETGLKVDMFTEVTKSLNKFSNLKTSNSLTYVLAGIFKRENNFDDCIIFNSEGNVAEAVASNIFLISKEDVFTPSLSQGCVAGIMREVIIEKLLSQGKKINEGRITTNNLLSADEIFLTNVIEGIRWVGAIKNKRYFSKMSRWLLQELNGMQIKKA